MNNDREALKKAFALLMWREHNPYDTVKVCDIVNQILDLIDNAPTVEESKEKKMDGLISRQDAIDVLEEQLDYLRMLNKNENPTAEGKWYGVNWARNTIADLPYKQNERPQGEREFIEILAQYVPNDLCTYPEYRGKPYYSIRYRENGEEFVGYGTYKIEVLSRYLQDYFFNADMRGKENE